jgi:hypothetical protein
MHREYAYKMTSYTDIEAAAEPQSITACKSTFPKETLGKLGAALSEHLKKYPDMLSKHAFDRPKREDL